MLDQRDARVARRPPRSSARCTSAPVASPPAWMIRLRWWPPSRVSDRPPSASRSKRGAELDQLPDPVRALRDQHPDRGLVAQPDAGARACRPGARPGESAGPSAAAMPPWAQRVEPSSTFTLVTTVTACPAARACSAAVRPAMPEPTTTTSAVWVQPGSAAASAARQARVVHAGPERQRAGCRSAWSPPTRAATSSRAGPASGRRRRGRRRAGRGSRRRRRAAPRSAARSDGAGAVRARPRRRGAAPGTGPAASVRWSRRSGSRLRLDSASPSGVPDGRRRPRSVRRARGRRPSGGSARAAGSPSRRRRRRPGGPGRAAWSPR